MRRSSFPAVFSRTIGLALLAWFLQQLAVPVAAGHQAAGLVAGAAPICTPQGIIWSGAPDDGKPVLQLHCPLCGMAQQAAVPPGQGTAPGAPLAAGQDWQTTGKTAPIHDFRYPAAHPRAPPQLSHA
ncbi:DUF2946 family protein [Azovibrio restrictus]|uniref:DUF2946 family protein n=1 Tax=Azovibrio restrictus TaxID=146938 RepID=UPI0034E96409